MLQKLCTCTARCCSVEQNPAAANISLTSITIRK